MHAHPNLSAKSNRISSRLSWPDTGVTQGSFKDSCWSCSGVYIFTVLPPKLWLGLLCLTISFPFLQGTLVTHQQEGLHIVSSALSLVGYKQISTPPSQSTTGKLPKIKLGHQGVYQIYRAWGKGHLQECGCPQSSCTAANSYPGTDDFS